MTEALLSRRSTGSGAAVPTDRARSGRDAPLFTTLVTQLTNSVSSSSGSSGAADVPPLRASEDPGRGIDAVEVSASGSVAAASAPRTAVDTTAATAALPVDVSTVVDRARKETLVINDAAPASPSHVNVLSSAAQLWLDAEVESAMRFANTELLTGYLFDPRFAFSLDKGLLLLTKQTMEKLNVTVVRLSIPRCDARGVCSFPSQRCALLPPSPRTHARRHAPVQTGPCVFDGAPSVRDGTMTCAVAW